MSIEKQFQLPSWAVKTSVAAILIGLLCFALGLKLAPERSWLNLLINIFYFVSLGLGGLVILAIQNVTGASWCRPFARIPEAFSRFLPVGLLLALGFFVGIHSLYEWSHPEVVAADALIAKKQPYLNVPFFIGRTILFFLLWIGLGKLLVDANHKLEQKGDLDQVNRMTKISVLYLITFAFSFSLFSYDFLMSLEPHWFSTIFGIYTFAGLFVNALAVVTLSAIILQDMGFLKNEINENHYHDLGKMIFGFSTFWAYIWFSQYILIWYSNIPEETAYYYLREHHTWDWLFYSNLFINWVIPFFALMGRESKRRKFVLVRVCVLLIVGHWLDLYLMAAPPVFHHANIMDVSIGWIEVGMALGTAGIFVLAVAGHFKKRSMVNLKDPYLVEGIHLHQ